MKLTFNINFHTIWGQKLCLVGSIPELGAWEPTEARDMEYVGDGNWRLCLEVPASLARIEYRYFLSINDKRFFEEWERNHVVNLDPRVERYTLYDYWQIPPANLAFYTSAFTKSLFAHPCDRHERTIRSGRKLVIKVAAPRIEPNQSVAITGNQACLGNWDPERALPLSCDTFPEWHIDLDATQISYPLEFKFLVWNDDRHFPQYWEDGENRVLTLPAQDEGETAVVSGLAFRDNLPPWRGAGSVIPVFSLRSEGSFGVGDFGDLAKLVEWVKATGQRVIQVLPVNDTTMTHTWTDSYPYSAISIYALHPLYLDLRSLPPLHNPQRAAFFATKQQELNAKDELDYEAVMRYKRMYAREVFAQEGAEVLASAAFKEFYEHNKSWLVPYAAYGHLRDKYHTPDFTQWGKYATYNRNAIQVLCSRRNPDYAEITFTYYVQYCLHTQLKAVSELAHKQGIVLKGDLPIGVSRNSVETWTEPQYFNMSSQAGAPPDDFSMDGQNWHFPTYNWAALEANGFGWWKQRFQKLADYFDCFRIDHILGFFRIWEIPMDYTQGLCGHFNPALPFTREEIEQYGLPFDEQRFTTPHINRRFLTQLFGEKAEVVEGTYLAQTEANYVILKPYCNTQRKIERIFAGRTDAESLRIRDGLYAIANEVLFLRDTKEPDKFHPRISASQSFAYKELSEPERYAFDQLYWHFFYHRHNEYWKETALSRLTPLVGCTDMLVCGEDLGMIPSSVPDVMHKLQIFSLEIERMPKTSHVEFTDLANIPYHAVCTTSTHDMSPLRGWWKEDRERTQRYFNTVLHREGQAPTDCPSEVIEQILFRHLSSPAMFTIIPLQDWFALDDSIKRPDAEAERINVPADSHHYWRYRMHITLEQLMQADSFNQHVRRLVESSGRK